MPDLITTAALLIEAVGSVYVLGYVVAALWTLARRPHNLSAARLLIADGALNGLNFKVAATLLKTLELQTWQQIALFAAIFALRTVLKRFFTWERRQLESRQEYIQ